MHHPCSVAMLFKTFCFELILWDAVPFDAQWGGIFG